MSKLSIKITEVDLTTLIKRIYADINKRPAKHLIDNSKTKKLKRLQR